MTIQFTKQLILVNFGSLKNVKDKFKSYNHHISGMGNATCLFSPKDISILGSFTIQYHPVMSFEDWPSGLGQSLGCKRTKDVAHG